ncbi:growth-regulated alpha protein isoform X1 [Perca flavescens]|uniref:growth-regulated alpha protein isoform X1 n=1 Tax=Perca flavescens TaxID=8167 RepID=UPI00106E3CB3|nr:growth-regulated alpha protein-like isoform X1 [Perca flavescens]
MLLIKLLYSVLHLNCHCCAYSAVLFSSMHQSYQHKLLHFVTICDSCVLTAMSLRSPGVELHCRCIQTESQPIGRHIEKVELIPANSHCEETEIIATLKKTGKEVCLDPEAPWVKRVINKILSNRRR